MFTAVAFATPPDANRAVSGAGIIDRVISAGSEPVFRADGYPFRVVSTTEVHFSGGLQALTEVTTNIWVSFKGTRDTSGVVVAEKAEFKKLKWPKRPADPYAWQVMSFPKGSKIDADKGFAAGPTDFPAEDKGGWCGWYPVPEDAALQKRIRELGLQLVPKYQRDLFADDPAKIPFRFYAVGWTEQRTAIFCNDGLVMIPMAVIKRLQSDDQLAAVLAEGVAGELQLQEVMSHPFMFSRPGGKEIAWAGVDYLIGGAASAVPMAHPGAFALTNHEVSRRMEQQRARMALALMADAGFNPRKAPDAWQLLGPSRLPKNSLDLKDTERSKYLESILEAQYNVPAQAGDTKTEATAPPPTAPQP